MKFNRFCILTYFHMHTKLQISTILNEKKNKQKIPNQDI